MAVDSAVMVIDSVNGVEAQTIKLLNVSRRRDTPILTFINKLDREGKEPIDLLDELIGTQADELRMDIASPTATVLRFTLPMGCIAACASRRTRRRSWKG